MLDLIAPMKLVPASSASPVEQLRRLRQEIEAGAGCLEQVDLNAALLLADVCAALGIGDADRRAVLGTRATRFVERLTR